MDHRIGRIDLIAWQNRKTRRARPGAGGATLLILTAAMVGLAGVVAQAVGWIHLPASLTLAPAALVLAAAGLQMIAVLRGVLVWIAG